jgi:hypothetical protein
VLERLRTRPQTLLTRGDRGQRLVIEMTSHVPKECPALVTPSPPPSLDCTAFINDGSAIETRRDAGLDCTAFINDRTAIESG